MTRIFNLLFLAFLFSMPTVARADVAEKINEWAGALPVEGTIIAALGFVVELVLRLWKSEKPMSILYFVQKLFVGLGLFFGKLGQILDKILPQKIQPPKSE